MKFKLENWLGWIVLFGPMSVILFVIIFSESEWLSSQSSLGATHEASKHNILGLQFIREGKYQEAMQQFMSALSIQPEFPDAYMNIGRVMSLTGDQKQAIYYLKKAAGFENANKEIIYNNLGMLYAQSGRLEDALVMFSAALDQGVKTSTIYRNIGNAYMGLENYPNAIQGFQEALNQKPTVRSLYLDMLRESSARFKQQDRDDLYQETLKLLEKGITDEELQRFDFETLHTYALPDRMITEDMKSLADAYKKNNEIEKGIQVLLEAVALTPDDDDAVNRLGVLYTMVNNLEQAKAAFESAVKLSPGNKYYKQNLELCEYKLRIQP